eukprot:TRINITY_DN3750_c0_g2_i2.p1 TRINITY_DN3750_c0_g2~~TRINITY_DN3750_c0_g2_i2.p1  ORF type:complete len:195 (+),score=38.15 TRINITY_DN3750_c0_g2_i2:377-961(+)
MNRPDQQFGAPGLPDFDSWGPDQIPENSIPMQPRRASFDYGRIHQQSNQARARRFSVNNADLGRGVNPQIYPVGSWTNDPPVLSNVDHLKLYLNSETIMVPRSMVEDLVQSNEFLHHEVENLQRRKMELEEQLKHVRQERVEGYGYAAAMETPAYVSVGMEYNQSPNPNHNMYGEDERMVVQMPSPDRGHIFRS